MFKNSLENIFTLSNLKQAFGDISSKPVGLDEMSVDLIYEIDYERFDKLYKGGFSKLIKIDRYKLKLLLLF